MLYRFIEQVAEKIWLLRLLCVRREEATSPTATIRKYYRSPLRRRTIGTQEAEPTRLWRCGA